MTQHNMLVPKTFYFPFKWKSTAKQFSQGNIKNKPLRKTKIFRVLNIDFRKCF